MKCYFCDKKAIEYHRLCIDAEPCHDGNDWFMQGIYDNVGLCKEHLEEYKAEEGRFNPYKYV